MVQVENEVGDGGRRRRPQPRRARPSRPPCRGSWSFPGGGQSASCAGAAGEHGPARPSARWCRPGSPPARAHPVAGSEVFGRRATEEMFMAWHYARYVEAVARAGKAEYPLPMFVNAALNRPGEQPGQYPSRRPAAAPVRRLAGWRRPAIDFLAPDIYLPNFVAWCGALHPGRQPAVHSRGPESKRTAASRPVRDWRAPALGFSPFAVESIDDPGASPLSQAYAAAANHPAADAGARAVTGRAGHDDRGAAGQGSARARGQLGGYLVRLGHDYTWEWSSPARLGPNWPLQAP